MLFEKTLLFSTISKIELKKINATQTLRYNNIETNKKKNS